MGDLPTSIAVTTYPPTYQAQCGACGWHTVPLRRESAAEHFAKLHAEDCPRPYRPNGATMECGCWWYARAGSAAGTTKATCPVHGLVLMVKANVPHPQRWGTGTWATP